MRHLLLLVFHLLRSLAILVKPGGVKALVADNLLLKHQLLILRRRCRLAPNLHGQDRLACGFLSLFLKRRRLLRTAVVRMPSTLLRLMRAFRQNLYRFLFSSKPKGTPGVVGKNAVAVRAGEASC
jgi:putative transposase